MAESTRPLRKDSKGGFGSNVQSSGSVGRFWDPKNFLRLLSEQKESITVEMSQQYVQSELSSTG